MSVLAACTNTVYVPQISYLYPPPHLLEQTELPSWQGENNQDLMEYAMNLKKSLALCNEDKKAVQALNQE